MKKKLMEWRNRFYNAIDRPTEETVRKTQVWANLVSAFLFPFAILAIGFGIYQAIISQQALELTKQAMVSNDSTAAAQIRALRDQVKLLDDQFEKENKPFLQVNDAYFTTLGLNQSVGLKISIINVGKLATKVESGTFTFALRSRSNNPDSVIFTYTRTDTINVYVSGINAIPMTFSEKAHKLSKKDINLLKNGLIAFFLKGEIRYKDLITALPRKFVFEYIIYDADRGTLGLTAKGSVVMSNNFDE